MNNSHDPQSHIREYLAKGGTLTVQQAFRMFHTTGGLRKVVTRLRRKGDCIMARWTSSVNEGHVSRYKVYYMTATPNT